MILKTGDMWQDSKADAILFTANSTVRKDGALVMGRGAAEQAQIRFPGCNMMFGKLIQKTGPNYGVILLPRGHQDHRFLGAFQVKYHFSDKADIDLIDYSCGMLGLLANILMPGIRYAVNFPGIGWGRLKREDVLPVISKLPDNVEVWEEP